MKRVMAALIIGSSALVFSAAAVSGHGFVGKARVIEATPQYETVEVATPVTECWTERVARSDHRHSYTAPLAGGLIGGVVGNQFGRGRGKTAMTVAGALLGASIGNDHNTSHYRGNHGSDRVQRCETVNRYEQEQQLVGYRVKYRYEGQTYYTQTTEHPGQFIPVRVKVSPVHGI